VAEQNRLLDAGAVRSRSEPRWEHVAEVLTLLCCLAVQAARFPLDALMAQIDPWPMAFADFVAHFWETGRHPWDPTSGFYYSPFAALLFVPFGRFDATTALELWNACQACFLLGLFLVGRCFVRDAPLPVRLLHAAALGTSLPLLHNFKWGQISAGLTLLVLGALAAFDAGRHKLAASLLAMAVALKGYPVAVIVPFLVLWRSSVLLTGALAFASFAVVLPVAALGWEGTIAVQEATSTGARWALNDWVIDNPNAQYALSVVGRWLEAPRGTWTSLTLSLASTLTGALAALLVTRLVSLLRLRIERPGAWTAALVLPSLPLIVPTSWPHYFVFLPAVQAFVAAQALRATLPRVARVALLGLVVTSCVLASSFVCGSTGYLNYVTRGMPFMASVLVLAAAISISESRLWRAG
jgi:hypothetical protein